MNLIHTLVIKKILFISNKITCMSIWSDFFAWIMITTFKIGSIVFQTVLIWILSYNACCPIYLFVDRFLLFLKTKLFPRKIMRIWYQASGIIMNFYCLNGYFVTSICRSQKFSKHEWLYCTGNISYENYSYQWLIVKRKS